MVRFFPFVSLGIGALCVHPARHDRLRPEDVASAAAQVKHKVKHGNLGLVVEVYEQPATDGAHDAVDGQAPAGATGPMAAGGDGSLSTRPPPVR